MSDRKVVVIPTKKNIRNISVDDIREGFEAIESKKEQVVAVVQVFLGSDGSYAVRVCNSDGMKETDALLRSGILINKWATDKFSRG